jgi:hypothetical protein
MHFYCFFCSFCVILMIKVHSYFINAFYTDSTILPPPPLHKIKALLHTSTPQQKAISSYISESYLIFDQLSFADNTQDTPYTLPHPRSSKNKSFWYSFNTYSVFLCFLLLFCLSVLFFAISLHCQYETKSVALISKSF